MTTEIVLKECNPFLIKKLPTPRKPYIAYLIKSYIALRQIARADPGFSEGGFRQLPTADRPFSGV